MSCMLEPQLDPTPPVLYGFAVLVVIACVVEIVTHLK